MIQSVITTNELPNITGASIDLLLSKWYPDLVQSMRDKCARLLYRHDAKSVRYHVLPGTMEFPYAAQILSEQAPFPDAIICLSVVLKGETRHFDMIINACSQGLTDVARQTKIPIINEILPVSTLDQAKARSADDEYNKGLEAAAAAIQMIDWKRHRLKGKVIQPLRYNIFH